MRKRVLILGVGQIGHAAVAAFAAAGWRVVVARRDGRLGSAAVLDVRLLDRDDMHALADLVAERFDAVIDTVAFDAQHAAQWCALQDRIGALVVISSGSVYADARGRTLDEAQQNGFPDFPIPIREDQPRVAPGEETYSTHKVALENALLEGITIPLTILRPLAIYGEGSRSPREYWFIARALAGAGTIPLAYDGASRFQQSAAKNIAALALRAIEQGGRHVLNAVDDESPTVLAIGRVLLDALGSDAVLAPFAGPPRGLVGRSPWSIPRPMIADMRAARAIGYAPVTNFAAEARGLCAALIAATAGRDWREAFPGLSVYPNGTFDVAAFRDEAAVEHA